MMLKDAVFYEGHLVCYFSDIVTGLSKRGIALGFTKDENYMVGIMLLDNGDIESVPITRLRAASK